MLYFDNPKVAGFIPWFADEDDPRTFVEQIHASYAHGGGWHEFLGFSLVKTGGKYALKYPEDPLLHELARADFRGQTIVLFQHAWLAVIENDKIKNIARID